MSVSSSQVYYFCFVWFFFFLRALRHRVLTKRETLRQSKVVASDDSKIGSSKQKVVYEGIGVEKETGLT